MKALAAALVVGFSALTSVAARADDILSADPRIEDGRLVITGTTEAPGIHIRLDGQTGAAFNVTSGPGGQNGSSFTFKLLYLPADCIVTLQKVTGATLGPAFNWLVADCGERGVSARGSWNASAPYLTDDLVTFQGSSWRAKRGNTNSLPAAGKDWELFAAKGATGPTGPTGLQGPRGQDGTFAAQRSVTKVCNDNGGWVRQADGFLICFAACAAGEVAFGGTQTVQFRGSTFTQAQPSVASFNPSSPFPYPKAKWFEYLTDSDNGYGHGYATTQVTVRILCGAP